MPDAGSQSFGESRRDGLRTCVFFFLFWLYVWLEVDLRLIYHGGGVINNFPSFYRGWEFFQEFLSYPGGLLSYVSAFVSQLWYYSWLGALVAVLQAGGLGLCLATIVQALNPPHWRSIRFVPALLLLVLYNQYTYRFVTLMALLVGMVGICLYLRITKGKMLLRWTATLILYLMLYYVAGGAYLVLAVFCVLYELLLQRSWSRAGQHVGLALAIPWLVGVQIFNVPAHDACTELSPLSWKVSYYGNQPNLLVLVYILYGLPLLIVPAGVLWSRWERIRHTPRSTQRKGRSRSGSKRLAHWWANPRLRRMVGSLVLYVLAGTVILCSLQKKQKRLFQTEYYAYHQQWPQAQRAAQRYTGNSFVIAHLTNRALHHMHALGDAMLSVPQHPHALFLTGDQHEHSYWYRFDTHLQLGLINAAEHSLTKALERFGERPMLLKRLALVNLIKNNMGTARVYLQALSRTLFDARWARTVLEQLANDPQLQKDPLIQGLRQRMLRKDCDMHVAEYDALLLELLKQDPQNRMAFEYLMAFYIMTRQADKLVQHLAHLDGLDYTQVPRLYEEVVIVHSVAKKQAPDISVSSASLKRWKGFRAVLIRHRGHVNAALGDLAQQYGDTYFFYNLYGFSGSEQ